MRIHGKMALIALALGLCVSGGPNGASAASKPSLSQAWKICKAAVDKQYGANTSESNARDRYLLGGACMKKYGYNL